MTAGSFPPPPGAHRPAAVPPDPAKGAWGGAWSVVYGCVGVAFGLMNVASQTLLLQMVRLGTAALAKQATAEENAEFARRLSDLVRIAPEALGLGLARWHWGGLALGVVSVFAGFAVLRRSDAGRKVAVIAAASSVGLSLALTAAWGVFVLPKYGAWVEQFGALMNDLQTASGNTGAPDFMALLSSSPGQQLAWQVFLQVAHAALVWFLVARLRGPDTRAWCAPAATPPARSE